LPGYLSEKSESIPEALYYGRARNLLQISILDGNLSTDSVTGADRSIVKLKKESEALFGSLKLPTLHIQLYQREREKTPFLK